MRPILLPAAAILFFCACQSTSRPPVADSLTTVSQEKVDTFWQNIATIATESGGTVGVAIRNLHTGDTLTLNDTARLPMQSAYKFPIAMAVLKQVDEGKLRLDQTIPVTTADLFKTYSPLQDSFPKGTNTQTVADLIRLMVAKSDNIACDVLLKTIGGTKVANDYIHSLGVQNISIAATEQEMHSGWDVQFTNWCNVSAYTQLLDILYKGTALSKSSNDFLMQTMLGTTTGPKRLPGLLPAGTPVAHKTGTSGAKDGMYSATNDAGIITLPNGQPLAVVVFVTRSTASEVVREGVIAKIAKAAYDHYGK